MLAMVLMIGDPELIAQSLTQIHLRSTGAVRRTDSTLRREYGKVMIKPHGQRSRTTQLPATK